MTNISDDECVAMKYVFANEDGKTFIECSDEEQLEIIRAKCEKRCQVSRLKTWQDTTATGLSFISVYRTLKPAPTPNQIDWSLVPPKYRYLYTTSQGKGTITSRLPVEAKRDDGGPRLGPPEVGIYIQIGEGQYGFKRGTVESIDSLLVRPIGE